MEALERGSNVLGDHGHRPIPLHRRSRFGRRRVH
jgi:hypothetical protein